MLISFDSRHDVDELTRVKKYLLEDNDVKKLLKFAGIDGIIRIIL